MISGFHHEADENCVLLCYYTARSGNSLTMFWLTTHWPFKGQESKKKAGNPSTEFISGRVRTVISRSSLVPANRVEAGGREGGSVGISAALKQEVLGV